MEEMQLKAKAWLFLTQKLCFFNFQKQFLPTKVICFYIFSQNWAFGKLWYIGMDYLIHVYLKFSNFYNHHSSKVKRLRYYTIWRLTPASRGNLHLNLKLSLFCALYQICKHISGKVTYFSFFCVCVCFFFVFFFCFFFCFLFVCFVFFFYSTYWAGSYRASDHCETRRVDWII